MATRLNVSVPDEQKQFLDDENKSASALLQDKIEEEMERLGYDGG